MGKKVVYTGMAEERLKEFQLAWKVELERIALDEKYIPGEDTIEITASDVDRFASRVDYRTRRLVSRVPLVLQAYRMLGIAMVVLGVSYEWLVSLLKENRVQFMILAIGLTLVGFTYLARAYFDGRRRRFEEYREEHLQHHHRALGHPDDHDLVRYKELSR